LARIAIIGAGAAGCFAAANIPAGHEVIVFEKTGKAMQKIKVSGGGRCNVTHALFDVPELVRRYPRGERLLRRTLYEFGPQDTIDWFKKRGVFIKEEQDGRMFPTTDDSQTIIDAIYASMKSTGAEIRFHKALKNAIRGDAGWELFFEDGTTWKCEALLLTAGSMQKPEQWKWLADLGHKIEPPAPSLFTFNLPGNPITKLMGVAVPDAIVRIAGTKIQQQGPVLITHWGLSGPAILRSSAWGARILQEKKYNCLVLINWVQGRSEAEAKETILEFRQDHGKAMLFTRPLWGVPRRLWEFLLERCGISETLRWGDLPAKLQQKLINALTADEYQMTGKTTFKEEFVTCGGIAPSDIDPKTMESKKATGMYFAGEMLDVDGITGGFNFQHAWASGWIAANAVSNTI
jgi:predicted Rossmann fold flavoprotein